MVILVMGNAKYPNLSPLPEKKKVLYLYSICDFFVILY